VGKRNIFGDNLNFYNHYGKQYVKTLKKKKKELPYNIAVPLPSIYWKERKSAYRRHTCIPTFIVSLFTISKLWNQCRCPSTNECIKTMWYYIYRGVLLIKNNKIMSFTGK
jgi:hypothetical protein